MRDFLSASFSFKSTASTQISTLSLHDALPIFGRAYRLAGLDPGRGSGGKGGEAADRGEGGTDDPGHRDRILGLPGRSEEHTSELQSQSNLVCRLLLEKKKHNHLR